MMVWGRYRSVGAGRGWFRGLLKVLFGVLGLMVGVTLTSPLLVHHGADLLEINAALSPNRVGLLGLRLMIYAVAVWYAPLAVYRGQTEGVTPGQVRAVRIGGGVVAVLLEVLFVQRGLIGLINGVM